MVGVGLDQRVVDALLGAGRDQVYGTIVVENVEAMPPLLEPIG